MSVPYKHGKEKRSGRILLLMLLVSAGSFLGSCSVFKKPPAPTEAPTPVPADIGDITITVKDANGNEMTNGVVIRVTGTDLTDDFDNDEFRVACNKDQVIVVYAPGGYQTSFTRCDGVSKHFDVVPQKLAAADNPGHSWIPAGLGTNPATGCSGCHSGQNDPTHIEFTEWQKSGHAKVFTNRFLETIYLGTDLKGNRSPAIQWDIFEDHMIKRAPTVEPNYRGPGFKLDYPTRYGNCAYCHAPASVSPAMIDINMSQLFPFPGGAVGEGVTCDVCHKVISINLNDNGYPYVDRPGILSFQFLRPVDNPSLQLGPLTSFKKVDTPDHASACSSVFSRSEFCAACHYGKFSDTVIYGSYKEWRESPFAADPNSKSYRTCQDCHMSFGADLGESVPIQRDACSAQNTSYTNFNHNMLNYSHDEETNSELPFLIKNAAAIDADFKYDPNQKNWFTVNVKVWSEGVGHRFPTDSPLRHLILVVEMRDQRGTLLAQVDGDRIPIWGGAGDITNENKKIKLYAGLPGKIYANLLTEEDTNESPTTAYWNETKFAWVGNLAENPYDYSDTRLVPGLVDKSRYSFEVPDRGDITVTIKLIYRFAFYDLMRQKGWDQPTWIRPDVEVKKRVWTCKRLDGAQGFECK